MSRTCRSAWRSRVITGADSVVNSSRVLADLHAPGDGAARAVLELAGDLDALLAGVLAERLDATACGCGVLSI